MYNLSPVLGFILPNVKCFESVFDLIHRFIIFFFCVWSPQPCAKKASERTRAYPPFPNLHPTAGRIQRKAFRGVYRQGSYKPHMGRYTCPPLPPSYGWRCFLSLLCFFFSGCWASTLTFLGVLLQALLLGLGQWGMSAGRTHQRAVTLSP